MTSNLIPRKIKRFHTFHRLHADTMLCYNADTFSAFFIRKNTHLMWFVKRICTHSNSYSISITISINRNNNNKTNFLKTQQPKFQCFLRCFKIKCLRMKKREKKYCANSFYSNINLDVSGDDCSCRHMLKCNH